jgi:hypothetical protein
MFQAQFAALICTEPAGEPFMLGANGCKDSSRCDSHWWKPGGRSSSLLRETGLELVLGTGKRLRIGVGVDLAVLRKVVEVLRA